MSPHAPSAAPLQRIALALTLAASGALAQVPDKEWLGNFANDKLGETIVNVGDCDADGTDDFAIASPHTSHLTFLPGPVVKPRVGRVLIISGATRTTLHDWYGGKTDEEFGYSVDGAGDIDGDGYDDVIVGTPRFAGVINLEHGLVQIFSGRTGEALHYIVGSQINARFGHSVAGNGDFNGDSIPDFAVGSPFYDTLFGDGAFGLQGHVQVYSGATFTQLATYTGGERPLESAAVSGHDVRIDSRHFGWSLDILGAYLAVGAPLSDWKNYSTLQTSFDTGHVALYDVPLNDVANDVGAAFTRLGEDVALSDVIPGGLPEIAAGAPGFLDKGRIDITTPTFDFPFLWDVSESYLGTTAIPIGRVVTFISDLDGDGRDDLAAGAPLAKIGAPLQAIDAGALLLYSSTSGAQLGYYQSTLAGDRLGASAATVTQLDGSVDLVIGVPGAKGLLTEHAGAARLYGQINCAAATEFYGHGLTGTNGAPEFTNVTAPILGQTIAFTVTNSAPTATTAWLFLGLAKSTTSYKGGTLLVDFFTALPAPMPANGLTLSGPLPDDSTLCGVSLYLQALLVDPGATQGVAFTRGLELVLGE